MKLWIVLISLFSSIVGAIAGISLYSFLFINDETEKSSITQKNILKTKDNYTLANKNINQTFDFKAAAQSSCLAVVIVKTTYKDNLSTFRKFHEGLEGFDGFSQEQFGGSGDNPFKGTGSGVILTSDGYIATNQHVVSDAIKVEVTLHNKKTYIAKVVGVDPTTDLALIKIEDNNLPYIPFGNSDQLEVGDWVLAVGNPFDLTSTVTAGIVSAKGRNIHMLNEKNALAVESFIQTDAAVNPGNSGGPLVNLKGELVGINTAIASSSGSFSGYSFAVPVSLVQKVMDDLLKFGMVQRAILGVVIKNIDEEMAKKFQLNNLNGVFVSEVNPKSAASKAKLNAGDIIKRINGQNLDMVSDLQEMIARFRPGDKIKIGVWRSGKGLEFVATLQSLAGDTKLQMIEKPQLKYLPELQAELQSLTKDELKQFNLASGVKVISTNQGKLMDAGIPEGFIISKMDKQIVRSPADAQSIIKASEGGILIEGYHITGEKHYFAIGW